jgi:hypothetical protein
VFKVPLHFFVAFFVSMLPLVVYLHVSGQSEIVAGVWSRDVHARILMIYGATAHSATTSTQILGVGQWHLGTVTLHRHLMCQIELMSVMS